MGTTLIAMVLFNAVLFYGAKIALAQDERNVMANPIFTNKNKSFLRWLGYFLFVVAIITSLLTFLGLSCITWLTIAYALSG